MTNLIVVGTQWGDEGKGKVTDLLSPQFDVVARYNGTCNAGHTVKIDGVIYKVHHLPSGIFTARKCVMGNGVNVDPKVLFEEIESIEEKGISIENLYISSKAHMVLPYHRTFDGIQGGKIGTTGRGTGPSYSDKALRIGLRVGDLLLGEEEIRARVEEALDDKNFLLEHKYKREPFDPAEIAKEYAEYGRRMKKHISDTSKLLNEWMGQGLNVLFEGAQGTLLDIDHGTYPFVTSSNSTAGGACTGCGIGPRKIDKVIGVVKAYVTRVGEGPFPTERLDEWAKEVQKDGTEFGTTTGRIRRVGDPDFNILIYARDINSVDEWVVTKLDVLDGKEFRIAEGYEREGNKVFPVYNERVFGWEKTGTETRRKIIRDGFDAMPNGMQEYLIKMSEFTGIPVGIASIGPGREETVTGKVLERTSEYL